MLGKYAAAFLVVVETIDRMIGNLEKLPPESSTPGSHDALVRALTGHEKPLADWIVDNVKTVVEAGVGGMAIRIEMPSVIAQARRIDYAIKGVVGPTEMKGLLKELRTRIFDELNEREFLYVVPARVRFYKEPMLMGKEVNDRFPKAIDDIEEAGKCLALGLGTACVMHTMRIMENGLSALANALGISYAPSWDSYLKQISDKIAEKHKNKTAKWKREQTFYRDLSGDLLTVKQAWRNPTMHIDRKYSAEEAEQIFNAAKSFMQRLAAHFTEKEMKKMVKKTV